MKVIATDKGYFGQVREAGAEFEVPEGTGKSSWFTPVKADPGDGPKKKGGKGDKPDADEADPI